MNSIIFYSVAQPMVRTSQSVTASISCSTPAGTLTNSSAPNTSVSSPTVMLMRPLLIRKNSSIVAWLCLSAFSPSTNAVTAICVIGEATSPFFTSTRFIPQPCEVDTGAIAFTSIFLIIIPFLRPRRL